MTINHNGLLISTPDLKDAEWRDDEVFINNFKSESKSNIDYISLKMNSNYSFTGPEAWIKWGEYSYCYDISETDLFKAFALFVRTDSLGKVGNFIKNNGVVNWSDSPTCKVA